MQKLFKDDSYPKPLFSVYFKTSLFTICLLPFIFWRPWHRLCCPSKQNHLTTQEDRAPPLPPTSSSASPRKSCLKSPENSATSERAALLEDRVDDLQSDTLEDLNEQTEPTEADCIVSINQETGQKEIYGEPSLCDTEASKQAEEGTVGRDSPETPLDGAARLPESTAARISESITIVSVHTYIRTHVRTFVPMFALYTYSDLIVVFISMYVRLYMRVHMYRTAIFDVHTLRNVYTYVRMYMYV